MLKKIEEKDCLRAIIYMWKILLSLTIYTIMFFVATMGFLYLIINNKFENVFNFLIVIFGLYVVCFVIGKIIDTKYGQISPQVSNVRGCKLDMQKTLWNNKYLRIKRVHRLLSMRNQRKPKRR